MTPREAVLAVLLDDGGPLHWTVVQDRALRAGYLDPFEIGDVRTAVHTALRELVADGVLRKAGTGLYAAA
ncbi:MAG: hypothetical protein ACXVWF_03050 [Actinomycetota bacterium]